MCPVEMSPELKSRFLASKQVLLHKFQEMAAGASFARSLHLITLLTFAAEDRSPVWQRPSFQEKMIPIFHVLEGAAAKDAHKGTAGSGGELCANHMPGSPKEALTLETCNM